MRFLKEGKIKFYPDSVPDKIFKYLDNYSKQLPDNPINERYCYDVAIYNLFKYHNKDKDVELCFGGSSKYNNITHAWVKVDGKDINRNIPNYPECPIVTNIFIPKELSIEQVVENVKNKIKEIKDAK